MEALTSVTVACLSVIDMTKSVDPRSVIRAVQVESKTGGKTGTWQR
jgi:cyclic pyranopterin phosphate synthase